MTSADLDELKSHLREYVTTVAKKSKSGLYECPLCSSGTGANRTGAFSVTKDGEKWKCFACEQRGDIFDLYGAINGCDNAESIRAIREMYGNRPAVAPKVRKAESVTPPPKSTSFAAEINSYHKALAGSEGETYLTGRGFTQETIERFNLGYDAKRHCVVIPYNQNGTYYGRRTLLPADQIQAGKGKYDKLPTSIAGAEPLFNHCALYTSDVVFVTEGALDAISIAQAGGAAISLNGTAHIKLLDQLKKKPSSATIVLCMDNDEAGRKHTEILNESLSQMGMLCIIGTAALMGTEESSDQPSYRKDPNEVLQKDGTDALRTAVEAITAEARMQRDMVEAAKEVERQKHTGAGMVDTFLQAIQTRKYEPVPTGITDIDKALGGGFIRQQLILLGAAPGAGKTALAQWIFEGMAKRGHTSVYLNLEMSREQILARSFSRIAMKNGTKITATDILQGYKWTDAQRSAVMLAADEYKADIAPRMIYNPDGVTPILESILEYIEREAIEAEQANASAPFVILDYLQILGSADPREDSASIIKRSMSSLKDYAIRHNTIVFIIMANNRESNRSGNVTMESGRDTSAIEYGADLQLGLAFTACLKDGKKPEALTEEERKNVTLKVTKARFANPNASAELVFDGATMTYTQKFYQKVNEPTPFNNKPRLKL